MKQTKNFFEIKSYKKQKPLFSGWFATIKEALETAAAQKINLGFCDLRNLNLSHVNLDNVVMEGAIFSGSNLHGANLSEGCFDGADFSSCDVTNACFAASSLERCNFYGASFSVTDFTDAIVTRCQFSCPSVFSTQFSRCSYFSNCYYIHDHNEYCLMRSVPVVIQGLPKEIVIMDDVVKIGHDIICKCKLNDHDSFHLQKLWGSDMARFLSPAFECERPIYKNQFASTR